MNTTTLLAVAPRGMIGISPLILLIGIGLFALLGVAITAKLLYFGSRND